MKLFLTAAALLAACAFVGGRTALAATSQDAAATPVLSAEDQAVIATQLPSYPKMACPISGEALGGEMGDPINLVRAGRLIRVCCKGCVKKVDAAPDLAIAKIDAAVTSEQSVGYPMTTCPVSGKQLASSGAEFSGVGFVFGTRLVRVCSDDCKAKFLADPAPAMAKIDAALIAAQVKTYKVDVCPVSGEKLGSMGEPIDMLYGTRLVRMCCKGCVKAFRNDGAAVLAKVDALAAAAK